MRSTPPVKVGVSISRVTLSFALPTPQPVTIRVYDLTGRLVNTLVQRQSYAAGVWQVHWDGTDHTGAAVSSGVYLCRLSTNVSRQTRKMLLLK